MLDLLPYQTCADEKLHLVDMHLDLPPVLTLDPCATSTSATGLCDRRGTAAALIDIAITRSVLEAVVHAGDYLTWRVRRWVLAEALDGFAAAYATPASPSS